MTEPEVGKGQKMAPRSAPLLAFALRLWPAGVVILGLSWLVLFNHLGSTGLLDETEPLFAEAARQMTVTGDWITPYFNGVTRFDKPPLIYWLMAIAYQTIGSNAFSARLPSALAATLLVGFCFYTVRRTHLAAPPGLSQPSEVSQSVPTSPLLPYLAAGMLALNTQMLFFGRTGYSDMLLNLCFSSSLWAFWLGYCQPDRPQVQARWYLTVYVAMALGVLTKGPVGVVLPSGIILLFLLAVGKLRQGLRELRVLRGGIIFLVIALPWYGLVFLANGDAFVNSFFGVHNLERFTQVVNDHRGGWYYHWLILAGGFLPWSIYLPAAIAQVFQQRPWRQADRTQQLGLLALIWFGGVMGFFTMAVTKYFSYSLPAVPAAAILVALWWSRQLTLKQPGWGFKLSCYASLAIAIGLAGAAVYSPRWLMADPSMPNLGLRLQQTGLPWIGCGIWLAIAISGTLLLLTRNLRQFWLVQLIGFAAWIGFFVTPALGVVDEVRQLPLRQIAATIIQIRHPQEPVLMASKQFDKPSLVFYSQQPVRFVDRPSKAKSTLERVSQTTQATSALMVVTPDAWDEINPQQVQSLQTAGIYQLIRIPLKGAL
jgi:4-amino-4-deoxy-L-arabinose transferase-like glycosyltransferase